ncbi:RNA polymerase sigma factor [Streptomyces kaempferi]
MASAGATGGGDESVRPWVYGIATNVLRNRGRSARKHQLTLARFPAPDTVPDFSDEVAERIDDGERLAAARAAVAKLRRGDRDVFMLCVWSDLSYTAASEALGIPVGTVRSRLSRARTRLLKLTEQELRRAKKEWNPLRTSDRYRATAHPRSGRYRRKLDERSEEW